MFMNLKMDMTFLGIDYILIIVLTFCKKYNLIRY